MLPNACDISEWICAVFVFFLYDHRAHFWYFSRSGSSRSIKSNILHLMLRLDTWIGWSYSYQESFARHGTLVHRKSLDIVEKMRRKLTDHAVYRDRRMATARQRQSVRGVVLRCCVCVCPFLSRSTGRWDMPFWIAFLLPPYNTQRSASHGFWEIDKFVFSGEFPPTFWTMLKMASMQI